MKTHSPRQSELCSSVYSPAKAGERDVWGTHTRQSWLHRPLQRTGKGWSRGVNSPATILAGLSEKNGVTRGLSPVDIFISFA